MKRFLLILILAFSATVSAQSKEHAGNYEFFSSNDDDYFLKDKLTLNPNGTFLLSSEDYIEERMKQKRLQYGKGTWTSKGRLIFLKTDESDIDATHTLNLNDTRLRYDTKSPRDKSNRDIKTSVRVIESPEVSWLKGRTLIKNANTKPKINKKACCSSLFQVHSYLSGKWRKQGEPNKEYHYSFEDEKGVFRVYEANDSGESVANDELTKIRIFKSGNGFKLEYNYDLKLDVVHDIKYLDSEKFITVRRDGKESVLYRLKQ